MAVLDILKSIWDFFATYVLQKAPYMVGFLTLLGYTLMGKKWYDTLGGTLKAIIGMLILNAGSGGLTSTFRTRKLSRHRSNRAERVMTLLPRPQSRKMAEAGCARMKSVAKLW